MAKRGRQTIQPLHYWAIVLGSMGMAYSTGDRHQTHLLSQGSRGRDQLHTALRIVAGRCIKLILSLAALVEQVSITDTSLGFP